MDVAAWLPREQSEGSVCSVWDACVGYLRAGPGLDGAAFGPGLGLRRRFGPDFQF